MTHRYFKRMVAPAAILIAAAACTSGDAMANDDFARELETSSGESGLLPASSGTSVVSAIEQTAPHGNAAARPVARRGDARVNREAPALAPIAKPDAAESAPAANAEAVVVVERPSPEPAQLPAAGTARDAGASAPLPLPKQQPNGRRRGGGVWTTGDVIRNAPFPINP